MISFNTSGKNSEEESVEPEEEPQEIYNYQSVQVNSPSHTFFEKASNIKILVLFGSTHL